MRATYSPRAGDLVGYTSTNGRVSMCARVIDCSEMHREPQPGTVWIRETGLRVVGQPFVCEAPIECLALEAR